MKLFGRKQRHVSVWGYKKDDDHQHKNADDVMQMLEAAEQ